MSLPEAMRSYLTDPALNDVWAAVRRRLQANGLQPTGSISTDLDARAAVRLGGLLGRDLSAGRRRITLADLDDALRHSAAGAGLVPVIADLTGPLRDRRSERHAQAEAWTSLWASLEAELALSGLADQDWVADWVAWLQAGVCRRAGIEVVRTSVPAAVRALQELPSGAGATVSLGALATRVTGSAHGLDSGTLTATVVVRALTMMRGLQPARTTAERRQAWWQAGVVTDAVSGTVITWALCPPGEHPWARMMRDRAELGLVTHLTARELTAGPPLGEGPFFATENPQVLQAAADAGVRVPVVCFAGEPSQAGAVLLEQLGDQVRYHGDFDWPGVAIASRILARGARPWRFDAVSYRAAVAASPVRLPLQGRPQATPWDPALSDAMDRHDQAVHEEALIDVLLCDLT